MIKILILLSPLIAASLILSNYLGIQFIQNNWLTEKGLILAFGYVFGVMVGIGVETFDRRKF